MYSRPDRAHATCETYELPSHVADKAVHKGIKGIRLPPEVLNRVEGGKQEAGEESTELGYQIWSMLNLTDAWPQEPVGDGLGV
jgi:hypothetical protein